MRDFVVSLCRRGNLASLEEGALIAGVSRSRVAAWLSAAGLDCRRRRLALVAKRRTQALARLEGKAPRRKPSKRQLRTLAERAKAAWDRRK